MFASKSSYREQRLEQLTIIQRREFKMLCDRLLHRSLDECHGACLFKEQKISKVVADAILKFEGERYDLDSLVIMPNHVHTIVQFREGYDFDTIGQSWMRYTARVINKQIGRRGVLWQPEPFDHIIRSPEQFSYLHRYIADNPKKANLRDCEYYYWKRSL
jgi:REP element-mobilizing transposase RayT